MGASVNVKIAAAIAIGAVAVCGVALCVALVQRLTGAPVPPPPPAAVRVETRAELEPRPRAAEDALAAANAALHRDLRRLLGRGVAWAVSPDGTLVAAGREDGTIDVWTPPHPAPSFTLRGPDVPVESIAFVGDRTLHALDVDGSVASWDLASRAATRLADGTIAAAPEPAHLLGRVLLPPAPTIAASPDGARLAIGATRPAAFALWDLRANLRSEVSHLGGASACLLRGTAPHLVAASLGGVTAFDLDAPRVESRLEPGRMDPPAIWSLRGEAKTGRLAASPGANATPEPEDEDAVLVTIAILDAEGLLVTLSRPLVLPLPPLGSHHHDHEIDDGDVPLSSKPVLAGWDLATGEQRWERRIAYPSTELLPARAATHVVISTPEGVVFCSVQDGTRERVVRSPGRIDVLAPDASAGYAAGAAGLAVIPLDGR